ncbi:hypothetical protein [Candidatus Synchoanobacter obligatus]|uniref:Uncharacterized protein n=1 Tax=Candidatus Synchoanobacter obligatus TaxID=2919597 RepID=A0ABT1L5Q5_9GAMM|nr:hypothetical protein [Candidatus Synchoanobacter obligatus]MCP8352514.1 hypothetical protein [Candidatus Synchoanobacter obligatus]
MHETLEALRLGWDNDKPMILNKYIYELVCPQEEEAGCDLDMANVENLEISTIRKFQLIFPEIYSRMVEYLKSYLSIMYDLSGSRVYLSSTIVPVKKAYLLAVKNKCSQYFRGLSLELHTHLLHAAYSEKDALRYFPEYLVNYFEQIGLSADVLSCFMLKSSWRSEYALWVRLSLLAPDISSRSLLEGKRDLDSSIKAMIIKTSSIYKKLVEVWVKESLERHSLPKDVEKVLDVVDILMLNLTSIQMKHQIQFPLRKEHRISQELMDSLFSEPRSKAKGILK